MGVTMDWLEGKSLEALLQETQAQVKREPGLAKHRVFLFQLLAVLGEWDRALTQLNLIGEMDASALPMVHTYRQALAAEAIALCLEALRLGAEGKRVEAKALRSEAFEAAPLTPGSCSEPAVDDFAWIADADERLGPMTEAIIDGKYYWVPFSRLESLTLEAPADLRDLVWMPAYFRWTNGGESAGLIPTRYPGSEHNPDDRVRIAARTEWVDLGDETFEGLGQRLLVTDTAELALMDIRQLTMQGRADDAPAGPTTSP
jgi:type VI secretion system protein ImpE